MRITGTMIQAGVKRATELGMLPRQSVDEDLATNNEIMLEILQAALEAYDDPESAAFSRSDNHS